MAQSSTPASDNKGPEAYRTISEVATELELPQHVLRFWETRFGQIKPMKRAGGRRFYRPQDIELLRGIRHLLYSEGLTIRGVQKVLREQGPRHVAAIGRGDSDVFGEPEAPPARLKPVRYQEDGVSDAQAFFPFPDDPHDAQSGRDDSGSRLPSLKPGDEDFEAAVRRKPAGQSRPSPSPEAEAETFRPRSSPRVSEPDEPAHRQAPAWPTSHDEQEPPALGDEDPLPHGILPEGELPGHDSEGHSGGFRLFDRLKREPSSQKSGDASLSREDVRDLQAALFELLECKRLLDRTR